MPVFVPFIAVVVYGVGIFLGSIVAGVGFRIGWDWAGRRIGSQG